MALWKAEQPHCRVHVVEGRAPGALHAPVHALHERTCPFFRTSPAGAVQSIQVARHVPAARGHVPKDVQSLLLLLISSQLFCQLF